MAWVNVTVRCTPEMAERIDAGKGPLSRSAYAEVLLARALDDGGGLASVLAGPEVSGRSEAVRAVLDARERLADAVATPVQRRCAHRLRRNGAWCGECRAVIGPDRWPVRVP